MSKDPMREQRTWTKIVWFGIAVMFTVTLCLTQCGCISAPPEVDETEQAIDEDLGRVLRADELVVEALTNTWRELGNRDADAMLEADLHDPENQVAVRTPQLPEADEDGQILLEAIEWAETRYLTPEMAYTLAKDSIGYRQRLRDALDGLLSKWRIAREGNLENFEALRDHLREHWSHRPGLTPAEIHGAGEGVRSGLGIGGD